MDNEEQLINIFKQSIPELYDLILTLRDTNTNPKILIPVVYHLSQISNGTGYGTINITIENNIVKFVKGQHSTLVELSPKFNQAVDKK